MTESAQQSFKITDPLPTGTVLLEASAGTGKTWTIGALITRYVAEGHIRLDQLLVVTFGNAASREMRDRIRGQLVQAEAALAEPHLHESAENLLLSHLSAAPPDEVAQRRRRLQEAISDFDAATIATTHQFCLQVLRGLGTAGDYNTDSQFVHDDTELIAEIVDDLYLAKYALEAHPMLTHSDAREIGSVVAIDPNSVLADQIADPASEASLRLRFAKVVRQRLHQRRRELGQIGFDDLLQRVEAALAPLDSVARKLIRKKYKVVLVDEFQDTDPVQWKILERAFVGHSTLVLIGDPKQAIYAFRGGDIYTYLLAAKAADVHRTLSTNFRSDAALVEALGATFAGAELGHSQIVVRQVSANQQQSRLADLPNLAPFRLRVIDRADQADPHKALAIGPLRQKIAGDLADEIIELLQSEATIETSPGEVRSIAAGDLAVLVSTGNEADLVHRTLLSRGIAAVVGGGSNVLLSSAAADWLTLLEAMESPHRGTIVRAAALTDFFGHTATELGAEWERLTDQVTTSIRDLAALVETGRISAVLEAVVDDQFTARVLSRPDGNRQMTDLRHVAQLLHERALAERLNLSGLISWLRGQRSQKSDAELLTRRLDSDAQGVQISTIWSAKGLEFPIVYLPFLFNRWVQSVDFPRFHSPDGQRLLDVGGKTGPGFETNRQKALEEDAGEVLRLTYVALTRAKSQLVAWWAPSQDAKSSGLHRLLFRPDIDQPQVPDQVAVPSDGQAAAVLQRWSEAGGPVVERVTLRNLQNSPTESAELAIDLRQFDRQIDQNWRRTSYSGLTRTADHNRPFEPVALGTDDEPDVNQETAAAPVDVDDRLSPMADLPGGTGFGSLIHGVLEDVDVCVADLESELRDRVNHHCQHWGIDLDVDVAVAALHAVLTTELGPLADNLTLGKLLADRQLRELDFEIPLGGGDEPSANLNTLADIADLLDQHLPADDPIRPFADRLREPDLSGQSLRGYLSGSIDLVLRLESGRFLVVDHKTNWLGSFDQPLTIAKYHPQALAEAMNSGTYPLQALLYSVVLHRFCRWRVKNYDPKTHLGGVLYLYVRAMVGADAPKSDGVPYGVFSWRPPAALIVALSDLLDGQNS